MTSETAYMRRNRPPLYPSAPPPTTSPAASTFPHGAEPLISPRIKSDPSSAMDRFSSDEDRTRGRRRSREADGDGDVKMADGETGNEAGNGEGRARKRRRSRKAGDKKFQCPYPPCTKSYSRMEHLHRHELNHNATTKFVCDFPGCDRDFVRQDLCTRHRERHNMRGSQLQRKDQYLQNAAAAAAAAAVSAGNTQQKAPHGSVGTTVKLERSNDEGKMRSQSLVHSSPVDIKQNPLSPTSTSSSNTMMGSSNTSALGDGSRSQYAVDMGANAPGRAGLHRANGDLSNNDMASQQRWDMSNKSRSMTMSSGESIGQRHGSFGSMSATPTYSQSPTSHFVRPPLRTSTSMSNASGHNVPMQQSPYPVSSTPTDGYPSHGPTDFGLAANLAYQGNQNNYAVQQGYVPTALSLPPPEYQTMSPASAGRSASTATLTGSLHQNIDEQALAASVASAGMNSDAYFEMNNDYMNPFGGDLYRRSPAVVPDNFMDWLLLADSQYGGQMGSAPPGAIHQMIDPVNVPLFHPYDASQSNYQAQTFPQQHPMSVTSLLDTSLPEGSLSEEKRKDILFLIEQRFNQTDYSPKVTPKDQLLGGDQQDDNYILSLNNMQTYIRSFWSHFHPQLPLLHKPTFAADRTPNLLLIVMMTIGASCVGKITNDEFSQRTTELAQFLAWHVRWEMFSHQDSRPPAKLWVLQALLLLEIYEKMYSTRILHERAHIHHATTITLMRRGSSLIGRSALESPPSARDDKSSAGGSDSSSNQNSSLHDPDKWWAHWITSEATRRTAFAAFVLDSMHATMFGHSAVMVAHEMRLPLPCDEALWSTTSSHEVGRVESTLRANGIKPTTFLEGLKKTLSDQPVRTNSFGRTVLMAGLLSVNYHMNQRDLQINSIGAQAALGSRDKWRGSLTRAFDNWKRDFDRLLTDSDQTGSSGMTSGYGQGNNKLDLDNVFESRTVLHDLAHMAMHVDIVDCQIFARATRLLGRSIGQADYTSATRRMKEHWAPSPRARFATWYALEFLKQVLLPEASSSSATSNGATPTNNRGAVGVGVGPAGEGYLARNEFLLNAPWVLYFAALITWSYGFALEGRINPALAQSPSAPLLNSTTSTHEQWRADTRRFLTRVGGVEHPDDLERLSGGRNECVGLLLVLKDMFLKTRWELLHEAARLLGNCVDMLTGGPAAAAAAGN